MRCVVYVSLSLHTYNIAVVRSVIIFLRDEKLNNTLYGGQKIWKQGQTTFWTLSCIRISMWNYDWKCNLVRNITYNVTLVNSTFQWREGSLMQGEGLLIWRTGATPAITGIKSSYFPFLWHCMTPMGLALSHEYSVLILVKIIIWKLYEYCTVL